MKDICNICSWEYDGEHGYGDSVVAHDNQWDEIPKDYKELLPSSSKENK